jgi:hypothetical protein
MSGRPTVKVEIDRSLDNDPSDPLRQVRTEESGLWSFYVPFSLTTNGLDARPGLYVIDVAVTFPHVTAGQPRFLQTRIRLNIPDASSGQRELVIDGDGQSVVNLAGHDLRSFSRVVLKGDDTVIRSGNVTAINDLPSPALATAGTGDVLAGVITAFLARGVEPLAAAAAAVISHSRAGRVAADRIGLPEGVVASDVIGALPEAIASFGDSDRGVE